MLPLLLLVVATLWSSIPHSLAEYDIFFPLTLFSPHSYLNQSIPQAPTVWDVVGPFPFAYRELGSDPLVAFGGIDGIPRADNSTYPSEVVNGGRYVNDNTRFRKLIFLFIGQVGRQST